VITSQLLVESPLRYCSSPWTKSLVSIVLAKRKCQDMACRQFPLPENCNSLKKHRFLNKFYIKTDKDDRLAVITPKYRGCTNGPEISYLFPLDDLVRVSTHQISYHAEAMGTLRIISI